MEIHLDESKKCADEFLNAIDSYEKLLFNVSVLSKYYSSEQWKIDFSDDSAGKIPSNVKRGVLSEDEPFDVLDLHCQIRKNLFSLCEKISSALNGE